MYLYDAAIDGEVKQGQTLLIYQNGTRELVPTSELYPEDKSIIGGGSGRDYWDVTDQIFFTGNQGYGISPELAGLCLGSESEILAFLSGGKMPQGIDLLASAELIRVKTIKEINEHERRKESINPIPASKHGAIKARGKRIGTIEHPKLGVRHTRPVKADKRVSGSLLRPTQPGLFDN